MNWDLSEYESNNEIPSEAKFDRLWNEINDVVSVLGVEISSNQDLCIEEYDESDNLIKTWDPINLSISNCEAKGIEICITESYDVDHESVQGSYYLYGEALNKGYWYSENLVEIEGEFNLSNLKLVCIDVEGWILCNYITYKGLKDDIFLTESSESKSKKCFVNEGWSN